MGILFYVYLTILNLFFTIKKHIFANKIHVIWAQVIMWLEN
jgi:hypothetical protein